MRRLAAVLVVVASLAVCAPARAEAPGTSVTGDGYGVVLGSAEAPARLEIFCEPQCPHCAEFEAVSGAPLIGAIAGGRVAVTYRWLTFLDDRRHNDASARIANALITAADPAVHPVVYQSFVDDLYRQQRRGDGPATAEIAVMARESGVPGPVADRIAAGDVVVDTAAMNAANRELLERANPANPGTPTVYDVNTGTVVDTDEPGWLDRLGAGR